MFASAARRNVGALRREYALREELRPDGPRVRLVHLAYRAAGHEPAAKMLDFSPSSLRDRWAAGRRDMASGLALLEGAAAGEGRRRIEALRREYAVRQELRPDGPRVSLVYLAYEAAGHELAGKTLDFSPSSIRDRWAAGRRDMAAGLAMLGGAGADGPRFGYLAVAPGEPGAAAEAGAAAGPGPALARAA